MIEVSFLRRIILFPQWQEPILNHTRSQLIERTDFLDRGSHAMGDCLHQLFVVNLPAQALAHELGELTGPRTGLAADTDVLKPSRWDCRKLRPLAPFAQAEKPAHKELGPALAAAQASLCRFGGRSRRRRPRSHALSPEKKTRSTPQSRSFELKKKEAPRWPGRPA